MKILIILSCVLAIQAAVIQGPKESESITINGVHYNKEVLKDGIDRPYFLAVDPTTNTLYFSYTVNDDDMTAKIDLTTKKFEQMSIKNGFSQTIDVKNNKIYFGTANGIYIYDKSDDKKESTVILPDIDSWQVYFNQILYYSDYPEQNIYTFTGGVSKPFEALKGMKISHFSIDKDGDIFYDNATGIFSQKKGDRNAVVYKELANGDEVRAITTDIHGDMFVCLEDGIYKEDKSRTALEKVLEVYGAFGLTFDRENRMVYSDSESVVYLTPSSQ